MRVYFIQSGCETAQRECDEISAEDVLSFAMDFDDGMNYGVRPTFLVFDSYSVKIYSRASIKEIVKKFEEKFIYKDYMVTMTFSDGRDFHIVYNDGVHFKKETLKKNQNFLRELVADYSLNEGQIIIGDVKIYNNSDLRLLTNYMFNISKSDVMNFIEDWRGKAYGN